ncbi:MAG: hypothetical protein CRU78_05360 [Candidatus Accumulibacter phosphatis]|uniref:Uncharacterized protein n=1 Tax=Candidatus Accumulibacter phosphatis TaxID=327160 RepID=A0A6A7RSC1_9PROT|nr:hypothetical protein [Candidatus Accumulibacter phosphatis]
MSRNESIVEGAALERFAAQRCEFKEAANNFSSTLATLRETLLSKLPSGKLNQSVLELRMLDLLPENLLAALRKVFGDSFDALGRDERLTLAAASSERVVSHSRVREMTRLHSVDATRLLQGLVRDGFLESHNPGRGAVYCLPGAAIPKPEEVFLAGSAQSTERSALLESSSAHLSDTPNIEVEQRDQDGCLLSGQLDAPVIDSLNRLTPAFSIELEKLAIEPRSKKKIAEEAMQKAILAVCRGQFVALSTLAELLKRDPHALRQQHLKPLTRDGKLRLAFPTAPTHAKQAYRSAE